MSTDGKRRERGVAADRMAPGAFGLEIDSDSDIPALRTPSAVAASRRVEHRLVGGEEITERCGKGTLTALAEWGEGPLHREYHQHSSGGTLIRTESYGEHLIADDGRSVLSSISNADPEIFKRYVLGQLLPVTASVQGLEIFHASAVATGEGVIAFAGPSGVGKSSLAVEMIANGAAFFVDDVLAIDVTTSGVLAYPGPSQIGVPHSEIEKLGDAAAGPPWASDERKAIVPMKGERRSQPVLMLIALTVDESAVEPEFGPCPPNRLMSLTFDAVSSTPERLRRLLRVSAMLAAENHAIELRFSPSALDSSELCATVLERLEADLTFAL